jgi:hypothetical protein
MTSEDEYLVKLGSSDSNVLGPSGRQLVTTELLFVPSDLIYLIGKLRIDTLEKEFKYIGGKRGTSCGL